MLSVNKFKRLLYNLFKIPLPLWTEEKLADALYWTQANNKCRKEELKLFDNEGEARAYYMNLEMQRRSYEQSANSFGNQFHGQAQYHNRQQAYSNNPFQGMWNL